MVAVLNRRVAGPSGYYGKHGFFGIQVPQLADLFHGLLIKNITAQAVYRIRGINNNAALFQAFYNLLDLAAIGIFGMDF